MKDFDIFCFGAMISLAGTITACLNSDNYSPIALAIVFATCVWAAEKNK